MDSRTPCVSGSRPEIALPRPSAAWDASPSTLESGLVAAASSFSCSAASWNFWAMLPMT